MYKNKTKQTNKNHVNIDLIYQTMNAITLRLQMLSSIPWRKVLIFTLLIKTSACTVLGCYQTCAEIG